MALELIDYPANLTDQDDFSAHGDLIEAGYWDKVNSPLLVRDGVIPQGAVLQVGGVVYHGTSDTAITGTASDYVRITAAGASATAEYVATLTGVEWSKQYNGYYDGAERLYLFDEGKALKDSPAVTALLSRYVTRTEDGDTYIGRDLDVGRNATVGGVDTFGGFHRGTNKDDTDLPIGSVILVYTDSTFFDRNSTIVPYRSLGDHLYTRSENLIEGPLSGTWRARGALSVSGTLRYHLAQRVS